MTSTRKSLAHKSIRSNANTTLCRQIDSNFEFKPNACMSRMPFSLGLSRSLTLGVPSWFFVIFRIFFCFVSLFKFKIQIHKFASNRNPSNMYPIKPLNQTNEICVCVQIYILSIFHIYIQHSCRVYTALCGCQQTFKYCKRLEAHLAHTSMLCFTLFFVLLTWSTAISVMNSIFIGHKVLK